MSQKPPDDDTNEPSLELPKMRLRGFGRKKKSTDPPEGPEATAEAPEPPAPDEPEPTRQLHLGDPETDPRHEPTPEPSPPPVREDVVEATPAAEAEPTAPLFVDEVQEDEQPTSAVQVEHPHVPVEEPEEEPDAGQPKAERTAPSLPSLPGRIAAIITGLVVGIFGTLLFYVSLRGCEAVKGTQSCGGPGFFLLVAILVLMVLFGAGLLAAWKTPDPRSTSFLAVGVLCVVVLVTLMEELFSVWMFVLVPLISAAAYSLSYWVTTRFVEPAQQTERQQDHDVR